MGDVSDFASSYGGLMTSIVTLATSIISWRAAKVQLAAVEGAAPGTGGGGSPSPSPGAASLPTGLRALVSAWRNPKFLRSILVVLAVVVLLAIIGIVWFFLRSPGVSSMQPETLDRGQAGARVSIFGKNFDDSPTVSISGGGITVNQIRRESKGKITALVSIDSAADKGRRNVTVTNPNGRRGSCNKCFEVSFPPPKISTPKPEEPILVDRGSIQHTIGIKGENFDRDPKVTFSGEGVTLDDTMWLSETELTLKVTVAATAAPGSRDITVINPDDDRVVCTKCLTVSLPPPQVNQVTPSSLVQAAGATTVTVTGENFDSDPKVTFSGKGVTLDEMTWNSETELTLKVTVAATAAPGSRDITVINPDERSATCQECLNIKEFPTPCVHQSLRTGRISGTAQIRGIRNNARVGPNVYPLMGTYRDLPPGFRVWVLVYSHDIDLFYPQTHRNFAPATLLSGGRFRTSASFGGRSGERYDVIVVFANPRASSFFSRTIAHWTQANDFPGLAWDQLPAGGLDEKACVVVSLR